MDETTDRGVCGMGWNWVGVDIYDTNVYAFRAKKDGVLSPHTNVYTVGGEEGEWEG